MTSEPRQRSATPVGIDLRDWRPGDPAHSRRLVAVGLGVIVSLVLVGVSVVAGVFVAHTVSAALFGGSQGQIRSGSATTTVGQQNLKVQSGLVERQREAVAAYSAQLTDFKTATARPPGAVGINLDAAEARRRDTVLAGLVLHCIDAVEQYNRAAQALPVTQLRSAGLPERYVWAVDCASAQ